MSDMSDDAADRHDRADRARWAPRVGDRWVHGERRITVTGVSDDIVSYEAILPTGAVWSSRNAAPLPRDWELAGRGSEKLYCVNHPLREREVGMLYCPECVDQQAASWGSLTETEAKAKTEALLLEDQGHA